MYHVSRTRPWRELERSLQPLTRRYTRAGGDPESEAVQELAAISLRGWLQRQNAGPELHSIVDMLRGFFVADPDDLSVLPVVEQMAGR
ncbi:TipAS antibiotic-recognition domain-containing protein, partial [Acinetobacter baumannii]|nr:TipAS antibiotic-recognition domain-containing protein [Acinetobacter baumannii]